MKIMSNDVLRASIKRILISIAFIITLIILVGFITISYIVGNSIVERKYKPQSYTESKQTLLILKMEVTTHIDHFNQTIHTLLKNDHN